MTVEIAADQHQSAPHGLAVQTLVQREALADEVKDMRFFALDDPQYSFCAEHIDRQLLQKTLELVG